MFYFDSVIISCVWNKYLIKKINKYTSYPKINQNLALKNLSCFLQTQKVLKSTANSFVTFCPNVNDSFSTLRVFFGHVSICNMRTWKLLQNVPKILPPSPCIKSWYHDKFHNFRNLFVFNGILKWFVQTILSMVVREQDLWNLLLIQAYVITLHSITWRSFFYPLYSTIQNTSNSTPKIQLMKLND